MSIGVTQMKLSTNSIRLRHSRICYCLNHFHALRDSSNSGENGVRKNMHHHPSPAPTPGVCTQMVCRRAGTNDGKEK